MSKDNRMYMQIGFVIQPGGEKNVEVYGFHEIEAILAKGCEHYRYKLTHVDSDGGSIAGLFIIGR